MKGLAASTGQEGVPEADRQPFISGTFEYGVGRPAAKRKVRRLTSGLPFSQRSHLFVALTEHMKS